MQRQQRSEQQPHLRQHSLQSSPYLAALFRYTIIEYNLKLQMPLSILLSSSTILLFKTDRFKKLVQHTEGEKTPPLLSSRDWFVAEDCTSHYVTMDGRIKAESDSYLIKAIPDEHKKFLTDLIWVYEEDSLLFILNFNCNIFSSKLNCGEESRVLEW
ncbi:hypothetical protein F0562_006533 [Nyssa sinensis]|uniref:Uncharacterized protein n=1 Tax=Nyssa sinensis TaxID=561372 RepID=A0A5J5ALZ2_9ASTE|nr:hypothetical protein F0562_006533 [Nyssa sinensis]